jgi:hypothetical protein
VTIGLARTGTRLGIEQRVDVGGLQPQVGQRLKRLPGMDRLREEDRVDAPRARARDDVGQDTQPQVAAALQPAQQVEIDFGSTTQPVVAEGKRPARLQGLP